MKKQTLKQADFTSKIKVLDEAVAQRSTWKSQGKRVVFTNGVFDLIHPGHVHYLAEAKALGDKLILGLNNDVSAKSLGKGPHRPINDEMARATVLAALEMVDTVVLFEDETPIKLISALVPDVLVKGGDYSIETIVGADLVLAAEGEVRSLQFVEGYSTTAIEQKIMEAGKNSYDD